MLQRIYEDLPSGTNRWTTGNPLSSVVWEAGHFYQCHGQTEWTKMSWEIMRDLAHPDHLSMVMIDDVHEIKDMNPHELIPTLPDLQLDPEPGIVVMESAMEEYGIKVMDELHRLPSRRKRPRKRGKDGRCSCSGSLLTTPDEKPMCLLYDLGLTWFKYNTMSFRHIVNVLPEFYYSEQHALMRIARRLMPNLILEAVLFDLQGRRRLLRLD